MSGQKEKIALREANKTADTTLERIYKSYFGKKAIELTTKESAIRDRWDFAFRMLCNACTDLDVVNVLTNKFHVTKSTAYDDLKNVALLFGNQKQSNKEFKRIKAEHMILRAIQKAWTEGKLMSYERLVGRYTKINGLEIESNNDLAELVQKLKPISLIFTLSPDQLKKEAEDLMKDVPTIEAEFEVQ